MLRRTGQRLTTGQIKARVLSIRHAIWVLPMEGLLPSNIGGCLISTLGHPGMRYYRNLIVIFSIGALVIIVSVATTFQAGNEVMKSREEVHTHLAAMKRLDDFLLTITTAETGQRGYLLTGDEAYLKPYNDAASQVSEDLKDLQGNDLFPKDTVRALAERSAEKLAELAQTIQVRRTQGPEAALARVRTDEGKDLMDKIRTLIFAARLSQQEATQLAYIHHDRLIELQTAIDGLAGLVDLLFLGWAYARISDDTRRREEAYQELARERAEAIIVQRSRPSSATRSDRSSRRDTSRAYRPAVLGKSNRPSSCRC